MRIAVPLALTLVVVAAAPAQTTTRPADDAEAPARELAPLPDLTDIRAQLTEIRGLEFRKEVPSARQSMEAWAAYLEKELDELFPANSRLDVMSGLQRLGLITAPIDLGGELQSALLSQAAAYYDPETGTFYYLVEEMPQALVETVAAHELVHALQDQHFGLDEIMAAFDAPADGSPRNDDRLLALRFLVEGEATYVQTLWQMQHQMGMNLADNKQMEEMSFRMMANMDMKQLAQMVEGQAGMLEGMGDLGDIKKAMESMDEIPTYIIEPLTAAYVKGAYYVMKLRHAGGWDEVAKAYASGPLSTEQVLHPEKFMAAGRDDPTTVDLRGLDPVMTERGWRLADSAIHGEMYLDILLRNFDIGRTLARRATAGWDGDAYRAYRNDEGETMIVFVTTWDTANDATEFFGAYREALVRKYPGLSTEGRQTDERMTYGSDRGPGLLRQRGKDVFAIEGGDADATRAIETWLERSLKIVRIK